MPKSKPTTKAKPTKRRPKRRGNQIMVTTRHQPSPQEVHRPPKMGRRFVVTLVLGAERRSDPLIAVGVEGPASPSRDALCRSA
jgi:hypothetical protein